MITTEQKQQFIIDTLLPYKEDRSLCAINDEGDNCMYLTPDGKKCALGKHMREGSWQQKGCGVVQLAQVGYSLKQMLTDEAYSMGFIITTWRNIQIYHDALALNKTEITINSNLNDLENCLKIDLSILKF